MDIEIDLMNLPILSQVGICTVVGVHWPVSEQISAVGPLILKDVSQVISTVDPASIAFRSVARFAMTGSVHTETFNRIIRVVSKKQQ